jgi:hypothetical protein
VDRVSGFDSIAERGFTQVPRALTTHAAAIGLKPGEAWLIVELDSLRFYADDSIELSYPAIGQRLGMGESSARRWLNSLRERGLIEWRSGKRDHTENLYDRQVRGDLVRPTRSEVSVSDAERQIPSPTSSELSVSTSSEVSVCTSSELSDVSIEAVEPFSTSLRDAVGADALNDAGLVADAPEQPPAAIPLRAAPDPAANDSYEHQCHGCGSTMGRGVEPGELCFRCRASKREAA